MFENVALPVTNATHCPSGERATLLESPNIDVLAGVTAIASQWHLPISAVALAGGTEGVNSVLKYLGYAKENKKNDAASKLDPAKSEQLKAIGRK